MIPPHEVVIAVLMVAGYVRLMQMWDRLDILTFTCEAHTEEEHADVYVLINERKGTQWRGDRQHGWVFDSPDDKPSAGK